MKELKEKLLKRVNYVLDREGLNDEYTDMENKALLREFEQLLLERDKEVIEIGYNSGYLDGVYKREKRTRKFEDVLKTLKKQ